MAPSRTCSAHGAALPSSRVMMPHLFVRVPATLCHSNSTLCWLYLLLRDLYKVERNLPNTPKTQPSPHVPPHITLLVSHPLSTSSSSSQALQFLTSPDLPLPHYHLLPPPQRIKSSLLGAKRRPLSGVAERRLREGLGVQCVSNVGNARTGLDPWEEPHRTKSCESTASRSHVPVSKQPSDASAVGAVARRSYVWSTWYVRSKWCV